MKRHSVYLFRFLCVLVVIAAGVVTLGAQSSKPKTVVDYFLLVPTKYFSYDLAFRNDLLHGKHRGEVIDVRNGYISWRGSDVPDEFQFVIFRRSNGTHVVAYNDLGDNFDDPNAGPRLILLSYERGKWRDVTRALLPPFAVDKRFNYKLPRKGRSIEVTDDKGAHLYTLTWANDRFHLKRHRAMNPY